ncbi:PEP-CTERM sorting domain-containing protein [Haloferula chungangensis]|uniref:PEP-CTERM sorting domain-containing protein n=1 Tax=Haloferula chungangensis TaxID=1048331 RepID=A0ABW2L2B3_9BACT
MKNTHSLVPVFAAAALGLLATHSEGAVTFTIFETGSSLVVDATGSINLGSATPVTTVTFQTIQSSAPDAIVSAGDETVQADLYAITVGGPAAYGVGGATSDPTISTGTPVMLNLVVDRLVVPAGYVSNASLSATTTYSNLTLQNLGATPGSYVWTISADGGTTTDTVTLNVIPEPSSALLAGLGGLALLRRRRRA